MYQPSPFARDVCFPQVDLAKAHGDAGGVGFVYTERSIQEYQPVYVSVTVFMLIHHRATPASEIATRKVGCKLGSRLRDRFRNRQLNRFFSSKLFSVANIQDR